MDKTSCYCYFAIKGDFDPSYVTYMLNLVPNKSWAKGDFRKDGSQYNFSLWETRHIYAEYPHTLMRCVNVIQNLKGKEDVLKIIKEECDVYYVLEIVPMIYEGIPPAIEFGKEVIAFCNSTGTDIDIDMYVYPFQ